MQFRIIIKWGTLVSVLFFCLAIGYSAYMQLEMTDNDKKVNLFSLVPSDCIGVLESSDMNSFVNGGSFLNDGKIAENVKFPGLFQLLLDKLAEYSNDNEHGLVSHSNRLLVSFHDIFNLEEQVVYLKTNKDDGHLLNEMLQTYVADVFLPKKEKYRGKIITVYPLSGNNFLATYIDKGFWVMSFQKRLLERVIDSSLDKTSLNDDSLFSKIINKKKNKTSIHLYARSTSIPFYNISAGCWSEYELYLNSDVFYLTGDTHLPDSLLDIGLEENCVNNVSTVQEDKLVISMDRDSTICLTNQAYRIIENGHPSLFNECVASLSHEADFSMVVDMMKVENNPKRFEAFLPPFILNNVSLFRPFILSAQLSLNGERFTQLWVFTYKN